MREHFTKEEAEQLVGQAYRAHPDANGYANVPPGTIGVVVDTYQARMELSTDDGGNWGVIVMWLRDEDRDRLGEMRNSTPGMPAIPPLMDHFSRADLFIRFIEDAEHAPGERAMQPLIPASGVELQEFIEEHGDA